MTQRKNDTTYSTSDLRLAALLKLKDFKLLRIDSEGNGRAVWVFEDRPDREKLVLSFLNREELVEPIRYGEEQRNLKGAIRGGN